MIWLVDSVSLKDAGSETLLLRSSPRPLEGADGSEKEGKDTTSPVRSRSVGADGGWGEGAGDTHPLFTLKNGQNLCNILTKYLRRGILLTGW